MLQKSAEFVFLQALMEVSEVCTPGIHDFDIPGIGSVRPPRMPVSADFCLHLAVNSSSKLDVIIGLAGPAAR